MKILIDENLPETITVWSSQDFIHARNLGNNLSDTDIWNYALLNNLIIISKDADFSHRILVSEPPPRIIHLRIGNMRFEAMNKFLEEYWTKILALSKNHKLVNVYIDSIEAVK